MNEHILIDTREKPNAIVNIKKYFDAHGIKYESKKLDFGDYMTDEHGGISIDRKQNIDELAKNCTVEHERFRRELERARNAGAKLVILVTQNRYTFRTERITVREPMDLIRWQSRYSVVNGDRVYRILCKWMNEFDLDVVFCAKNSAGHFITKILFGGE